MNREETIGKIMDTLRQHTMMGEGKCYIAANGIYNAGYRFIPELRVLGEEEKLSCSLVSRYPYSEIKEVIDETCLHQRDYDQRQIKGEEYDDLALYLHQELPQEENHE